MGIKIQNTKGKTSGHNNEDFKMKMGFIVFMQNNIYYFPIDSRLIIQTYFDRFTRLQVQDQPEVKETATEMNRNTQSYLQVF